MTYRFKPFAELYWGVAIAMSLVLLQALLTLDPEKIVDWRVWAVALGGAAVRAGAGAALDYIRRSMTGEPEPTLATPLAIMHRQCTGAAFLSLVEPRTGDIMAAGNALHVNGRPILAGSTIACDSCGAKLAAPMLRDGFWIAETAAPPPLAPDMPISTQVRSG